jgi:phenylalanyl-tRNA synthetase beta chain
MRTSVTWLNDYLDPPATAEEQARVLTAAGFPLDGEGIADNGEPWQEIEITSNRGDCIAHLGFAREICAVTGRRLKEPRSACPASGPAAETLVAVVNERPDLCPLYTARVIRGVRVRPSPEWLRRRLEAIGLVPRNNLVDATNFVLFELGQPTHVFDLATLAGPEIRVRCAREGETLLPIGEGAAPVRLRPSDLVIADRDRPVAIAGVKGGAESAVREGTTDILLEAATFAPIAVRATSRALRLSSDSSYRFERGVHPAEVDAAAERLASLILELAGGTLAPGVVRAGATIEGPRSVSLRPRRVRSILGVDLPLERMLARLEGLGFAPRVVGRGDEERIECIVPARRLDVEREIDLIEEICRTEGLAAIPVRDAIPVRVVASQPAVSGRRAMKDLLVGLGFVECITHSLVSEQAAYAFASPESCLLVDDERAGGEPVLRPSVLPSLLRVRRHNLDNGIGELDLFEYASCFTIADDGSGRHRERMTLALLVDAPSGDGEGAARRLRGAIERIATLLAGSHARTAIDPTAPGPEWLAPGGSVSIDGTPVGAAGLLAPVTLARFGLDRPLAAAELDLEALLSGYPPETRSAPLPAHPGTDRDISAIVDERVRWADLVALVEGLALPNLESIAHVATYRGKQTGPGRKSVTMRLLFRAADRTLRGEEADAAVATAVAALRERLGAEIRS